jgi:hypothetical protein
VKFYLFKVLGSDTRPQPSGLGLLVIWQVPIFFFFWL